LETHDAEADGAVAGVGGFSGVGGVEVDVDDVIEGSDGDGDGLAEHVVIEHAVFGDVGVEDDGAEVTDGRFFVRGVEGDLGAQVAGVDDADVVLRAAEVAGVLEGNPGVTGFEDHLEHLLPEVDRFDFAGPDFAFFGHFLVFEVALFEGLTVEVVEVGAFVGAKESPVLSLFHAFHEEVGHPVGGVHVVGATAFVPGVDAELEKVLDIVVPGLEVGAAGTTALSALVNGDELVVVKLQERNDALRFAIGALNVATGAANGGPRAPESAGPLGEVSVFGDAALHDGLDGVIDLVEVAGGELAVEGAGVEESGRGGAEFAAFIEVVKADDPVLGVRFLGFEESHGNPHPEELGRFHTAGLLAGLVDLEVAIVEGGDSEEIEIEVSGGIEGVGETVDVVFIEDILADAFDFDAVLEVGLEVLLVGFLEGLDAIGEDIPREDFFVDVGKEDASGELGHVGVLFEEGLGVEDDGLLEVLTGDFGADGAAELVLDIFLGHGELEADHGKLDTLLEFGAVPELGLAVLGDGDEGFLGGVLDFDRVFEAEAGALVAIADVVGGDLKEALAHEFFLNKVLDILDVDEGLVAEADAGGDGMGDALGAFGVLLDGEKGPGDRLLDLGLGPGDDVAIPPDEANGHGVGLFVDGDFASALEGALEDERLGDVVGVVFDESLLDEEVEVVLGELEVSSTLNLIHERLGNAVGDGRDEGAVFVGEDGVLGLVA